MKLALIVKRACETCQLVSPLVGQLQTDHDLTVYSQDDPEFPRNTAVTDDRSLEQSWRWRIQTVPTLILFDETGKDAVATLGKPMIVRQQQLVVSLYEDDNGGRKARKRE